MGRRAIVRALRALSVTASGIALAAVTAGGCSLVTDLSGLSSGGAPADAQASDDAGIESGASVDARSDAPVSTGPYFPKFERSIEVTNLGAAAFPVGHTACFRGTPDDIFGANFSVKVRADLADLRVFSDGVERQRVLDVLRNGTIASCFRLVRAIAPGASDKGYIVRYGDPNAAQPPPASADVFDFYDGFDGAALAPRWLQLGSPKVAGGVLTLPKGQESAITTVAASDGIPLDATLEIRARVTNPASPGQGGGDGGTGFFYWFGFQHEGDFEAYEPWSVFIARSSSTIRAEHKTVGGACGPGCDQPPLAQPADFRVFKIDRTGAGALFTYDDGTTFAATGGVGDLSIMIRSSLLDSELIVDWVRAYPFIAPGPDAVIGPEVMLQ